jgi:hypothetical protein
MLRRVSVESFQKMGVEYVFSGTSEGGQEPGGFAVRMGNGNTNSAEAAFAALEGNMNGLPAAYSGSTIAVPRNHCR